MHQQRDHERAHGRRHREAQVSRPTTMPSEPVARREAGLPRSSFWAAASASRLRRLVERLVFAARRRETSVVMSTTNETNFGLAAYVLLAVAFSLLAAMTLQDGVHFLEGLFIVVIACVALYIGRYLYQDEQAKIAAVSCRRAKLARAYPSRLLVVRVFTDTRAKGERREARMILGILVGAYRAWF